MHFAPREENVEEEKAFRVSFRLESTLVIRRSSKKNEYEKSSIQRVNIVNESFSPIISR